MRGSLVHAFHPRQYLWASRVRPLLDIGQISHKFEHCIGLSQVVQMGRVQAGPAGVRRGYDEGWAHEHGRKKVVIVADCVDAYRLRVFKRHIRRGSSI